MRVNGIKTVQVSASRPTAPRRPQRPQARRLPRRHPRRLQRLLRQLREADRRLDRGLHRRQQLPPPQSGPDLYPYDTATRRPRRPHARLQRGRCQGRRRPGHARRLRRRRRRLLRRQRRPRPGAAPGNCTLVSSTGTGACNLYLSHDGGDPASSLASVAPPTASTGRSTSTKHSDTKDVAGRRRRRPPLQLLPGRSPATTTPGRARSDFGGAVLPGPCTRALPLQPRRRRPHLRLLQPDRRGAPRRYSRLRAPAATAFGAGPSPLLTRNISADGNRVFFDTADSPGRRRRQRRRRLPARRRPRPHLPGRL